MAVMLPILLIVAIGGGVDASAAANPLSGELDTTKVPNQDWVQWILKAGQTCTEVTPPLIAAQIETESSWDPNAQSDIKDKHGNIIDHAHGLSQFIPSTWADHGVNANPDVDDTADPLDPADAIMSQAAYDCYLLGLVKGYIANDGAQGDPVELMLAAYNAGPDAVRQAKGVPDIDETRNYVLKIRDLIGKYSKPSSLAIPPGLGTDAGKRAVAAAETALGTSYRYGGDCSDPHSSDIDKHCDCSSLMQMAWGTVGVHLARVTTDQVNQGTSVPDLAHLQAGDLLFTAGSDGTASAPGHVGMYMGDGHVIEAPHTGTDVRIDTLDYWAANVVAMRHIA